MRRRDCVLLQEVVTGRSSLGKKWKKCRVVILKSKISVLGWKKGQPIEERIVPEGLLLKPIASEGVR